MQCPVCDLPLLIIDRSGIEIHQCSACNGLWLSSADLDDIIENEAVFYSATSDIIPVNEQANRSKARKSGSTWDDEWDDDEDYYEDRNRYKERKRPRKSRKEAIDELY